MRIRRLVLLAIAIAVAAAACDRVVDLTPPPDAVHDDAHAGDSALPDGGASDGGTHLDAGGFPDGSTVD